MDFFKSKKRFLPLRRLHNMKKALALLGAASLFALAHPGSASAQVTRNAGGCPTGTQPLGSGYEINGDASGNACVTIAPGSAQTVNQGTAGVSPWPVAPNSLASGVSSVTGTITSATQSSTFTPTAGRLFNITISGTWTGSCQLEREFASTWYPVTVTAAGSVIQVENWTANASDAYVEGEASVPYRINCASTVTGGGWVSGTISYRFDQ